MSDEITNEEGVIENTEIDGTIQDGELDGEMSSDVMDDLYEPDFTYKVKDEERQFDERLRGVIVDKESEDYLRDLYTRADGLDSVKERATTYESQMRDYQDKYNQLHGGVKTLKDYREQGDYRKLFSSLGVNDDAVLDYAYKLAEEAELPEHEREMMNQNREYQERLASLESQLQRTNNERRDQAVNNDLQELESYVGTNRELDDRMKQAGFNLRDEVISYGITATRLTGKEPSIAEATNSVISKFNNMFAPPASPAPVQQEQTIQQEINNRPAALPKVNGSNQTAPNKRFTFDELKALSQKVV